MELLHPSDRKRFKNLLRRAREDVQPFVEMVREQVPAVREAMKEAEKKLRGSWTAVSESFDEPETKELETTGLKTAELATAASDSGVDNTEEAPVKPEITTSTITPWPGHQKVPPDTLEDLVLIQRGGFGDIYRGRSRTWRMQIALKMIRGADRHTMNEINKEANMMKIADFPYVLRLLGLYQKKEGEYVEYGLVMEYMPNGSLYTLFRSVKSVPWALRFQVLHQVALGMNYLHSLSPPLLHLDLKPKNILLNHSLDVRLADFGLSKLKNITSSGDGGGVGGTWPYKAPESLNDINYRPKEPFDLYSYGILTWSVLSGEEPYPNADTDLIKLQVPQGQRPDEKALEHLDRIKMVPESKNLMRCCWDQEPEARPPFLECIERTEPMFAAYVDEICETIRSVQDQLKKPIRLDIDEADSDFESEGLSENTENTESFHPSFFASN